jgi:outer membrane biosynthesis protein TonB
VTDGYAFGKEDDRRRRFRRTLIFSTVGHALLLLGLVVSAPAHRGVVLPSAITVDLVAARAAAPAPPRPAPKPKPKQVVLPEKPRGPELKPQRRKEVVLEPKPKEEKSLDDLLAQFREESGEPEPQAPAPAPEEAVVARAPTSGIPVEAETMRWMRAARIRVMEAWVVPPQFRLQALQTEVRVALDASGEVLGTPRILRRSGNPWYDEGVVRSIQKASPLPPPPEPGDWTFIFDSDESY